MKKGWLYKEDKNKILERDQHKCRRCGNTSNLQIHHMNICNYYAEDHIKDNLITLCVQCHMGLHSKKWQLEDIGVKTPEIRYGPLQPGYYEITDEHWSELLEKKAII